MQFVPCKGSAYCTQDGSHCRGCGRSREEIDATRKLVDAITEFVLEIGYENAEEFTAFVGAKAANKIAFIKTAEDLESS